MNTGRASSLVGRYAGRVIGGIAIAVAWLALSSLPAFAQVTYSYTGNPFTLFSCGGNSLCGTAGPNGNTSYSATDIVTGTLTLATALPGGLTLASISSYPGFKIVLNDGHQTMTATVGYTGGFNALVSTDAAGKITEWVFVVNCCFYPNNGIATVNNPGGSGIFDQAVLSAPSANNGYPNTPLNMALNTSAAGTWGPAGGGAGGPTSPTGTFIRVTQCCDHFDNVDAIYGGVGKANTGGAGGSNFGYNAAQAHYLPITLNGTTVINIGPAVGAFSLSNLGVGFGRAIAFATFTNNTGSTALIANAVLSGLFQHDFFGLPDGWMNGGAAIHVFDTDAFNAALNNATNAGTTVGQFLLGGYTPLQGLLFDPNAAFANLNALFSGGAIGYAAVVHANYNATAPFDPVPVADSLSASFTIGLGKSFTVVFDVAASSFVGGFPGYSAGTGAVDLSDTLKPAANFFTDASGNPVTGIGVVSAFATLPPAASALSLAPATGSALMETPYTVTATATDLSNNPVAGVPVKFVVTNGPDKPLSGVGVTDANGVANFTYVGQGGPGTDTVQANIGSVVSYPVQITWQPAKCPEEQGFWKNNTQAWPLKSLTLGSQTYGQTELLTILNNPGRGDASMILAAQLIAEQLNVAGGSDPRPIRSTALAASQLLSGYSGKLPYGVKPSSKVGLSMTLDAAILALYNYGTLTLHCTH
jgi:hypothetical protein